MVSIEGKCRFFQIITSEVSKFPHLSVGYRILKSMSGVTFENKEFHLMVGNIEQMQFTRILMTDRKTKNSDMMTNGSDDSIGKGG